MLEEQGKAPEGLQVASAAESAKDLSWTQGLWELSTGLQVLLHLLLTRKKLSTAHSWLNSRKKGHTSVAACVLSFRSYCISTAMTATHH